MAEVKYKLPGPETITMACQTIDKLLRAGDGDAALLYLYILRTGGQNSSEEAAAAMGKSAGWVATAMALLSRIGLIECGEKAFEQRSNTLIGEPRRYSVDEIKREIDNGSEFSTLVDETQSTLGKILSPDELERLFGMYDNLRLPAEVILLLITHCISESRGRGGGRMPSVRYIEKAAYTWENEGIFTLERAEEYLKNLELRKSARGMIKEALDIRDRELSATERRYVDEWISMGFEAESVGIAYDRTVVKTGNRAFGYMDAIMRSWHNRGIHAPDEIMEKDGKPGKNTPNKPQPGAKRDFGAPDREEIQKMERLRKRIKDE